METLTPSKWIAACAERLHERWQTVEPGQLEEVAVVIWQDADLRAMAPAEAAASWLKPISLPVEASTPEGVEDVPPPSGAGLDSS